MNNLKFYKTPDSVVKELFRQVNVFGVKMIVDVGAGEGALLSQNADDKLCKKIAIEVNQKNRLCLMPTYDSVHLGDLFQDKINQIYKRRSGSALFVSNPPFGETPYTEKLSKLMNASGFCSAVNKKNTYRMELVFIARVLEAALEGDQAAFIVPVSLVSQQRFTRVREILVKNHGLYACALVPDNVFKNTEVRTAILWFKPFSVSVVEHVKLYNQFGSEPLMIPQSEFIKSGSQNEFLNKAEQGTLGSIVVDMKRGVSSKRSLLDRGIKHIHTSDLNQKHASVVRTPSCVQGAEVKAKERYAEDGDILMARVGSRVVGRTAIFSGTKAVISDCVIRIRVADKDRSHLFKGLVSTGGQRWLRDASTGSCARLLSYRALNKFPLINEL